MLKRSEPAERFLFYSRFKTGKRNLARLLVSHRKELQRLVYVIALAGWSPEVSPAKQQTVHTPELQAEARK